MTIIDKSQIKDQLDRVFNETIEWIDQYPDNELNKTLIKGKWTAAGHGYHLIKSTKAVSMAMKKPKLLLRWMFGTNNRQEKTYDQLKDKYYKALQGLNVTAPKGYAAEEGRIFSKSELVARLRHELDQILLAINKWDEQQLTKLIVPHPAMGKMTIREVLFFTIFHTQHHLQILKTKYDLKKEIRCQ